MVRHWISLALIYIHTLRWKYNMKKISLILSSLLTLLMMGCDSAYEDFSRERLNDGIQVGAPDDWRWARDGLQRKAVLLLAGEPKADYNSKSMRKAELGTWEYETEIKGVFHQLFFNRDGLLVFCEWYDGILEDPLLDAPQIAFSKKLKINYPRCVPAVWSGESENGYQVEVDIKYPDKWGHSATYFTRNRNTVHKHTGANEGRWRVRKLSMKGYGPWSEYVEFECIR